MQCVPSSSIRLDETILAVFNLPGWLGTAGEKCSPPELVGSRAAPEATSLDSREGNHVSSGHLTSRSQRDRAAGVSKKERNRLTDTEWDGELTKMRSAPPQKTMGVLSLVL